MSGSPLKEYGVEGCGGPIPLGGLGHDPHQKKFANLKGLWCVFHSCPPGEGGTPYNGLHGEAPPERGTFLRLQVYKRVGISQVEVYKRVGKLVI